MTLLRDCQSLQICPLTGLNIRRIRVFHKILYLPLVLEIVVIIVIVEGRWRTKKEIIV